MRRIAEIALLMLLVASGMARAQAVPVGPAMALPGGTGGGGGGAVNSVGATAPLGVGGTASAPVINLTGVVGPGNGGFGLINPTLGTIPIAEGAGNFHLVTCGANLPLVGQGSNDPICQLLSLTAGVTGTLPSANGGSGVASPTAHSIMVGEGASAMTPLACANNLFLAGVTGADPACRALVNSDLPTSGITAGSYTNSNCTYNAQGIATGCTNGTGTAIAQHTLTESAGAATMVVTSSTVPIQDDETIALNANLTLTTPAAAGMATGQRVFVHATTSGTGWTVTFAAGVGVTLKDSVLGGSNGAVGQACTVPTTGWMNYAFRWDGTNFELLYCGPQPGPTALTTSVGGTSATSISGWPINLPHTETISGATNEALQTAWVTTEVMTFSASATVTLPQAAWAGQVLNAIVCQNGTGGFTPSFAAAGGLTIVGTFPVFTTTISKCGDFSLTYTTTTQAYVTGSSAGPL